MLGNVTQTGGATARDNQAIHEPRWDPPQTATHKLLLHMGSPHLAAIHNLGMPVSC
jgi:hypothetical protein